MAVLKTLEVLCIHGLVVGSGRGLGGLKGIISVALNEEEPAFVGGARKVRERQTRGKGKAAVALLPKCLVTAVRKRSRDVEKDGTGTWRCIPEWPRDWLDPRRLPDAARAWLGARGGS